MALGGFLVVIVILSFQVILAVAIMNDARSRGDAGLQWLLLTLVLGIFGALFYLVQRSDEKLPEEERPKEIGVKALTFYSIAIVGGLLLGLLLAASFNSLFAPVPCTGDSQGEDVSEGGVNCAQDSPQEIVDAQQEVRDGQQQRGLLLSLAGGFMVPGLLYQYSTRFRRLTKEEETRAV